MKTKYLFVFFTIITSVIISFYIQPASIMVGNQEVALKETKAEVLMAEVVGSWKGYIHCPITGLTFYLNRDSLQALEVITSSGQLSSGMTVSPYAIKGLKRMTHLYAYSVVQEAVEKSTYVRGEKLVYPLRDISGQIVSKETNTSI